VFLVRRIKGNTSAEANKALKPITMAAKRLITFNKI
jgi:hypothetical protein